MSESTIDIEAFNDELFGDTPEQDDPVVLAYRIGDHRHYVRLHRSEVRADVSLVEVGRSAQSAGYDPEESLKQEAKDVRQADPYIQRKIQFKLMAKEIRKRINEKNLSLKSFPEINDLKSMSDPVAHFILTLVTDQLIAEGLWRDEDKDLTMSEAFPLSQATNESRIRLKGFDEIQESTLWQDSDLTTEDVSEGSVSTTAALVTPIHLPTYATPMLNNLMRASPKDIYHQVARRMIETHYFQDHPELKDLYRACYFASKGVEDEAHFLALMEAGLCKVFLHYTFMDFRLERVTLRKHMRILIGNYFSQTPAIQRQLKLAMRTTEGMNVWARFYKVWNALTKKQKEALESVYMDQDRLSKKRAAEKFGISINSLVSRLRVAVLRFKSEFQEFEGMSPKRIAQKALRGSLALNGLWRYQSALWRSPLFAVDPVTGLKREVDWKKLPRSKNLDWKTVAHIKAQIIENCPVPYILDTEYFDGMKPTIMSMGRRPEKPQDGDSLDLDAGFRDMD